MRGTLLTVVLLCNACQPGAPEPAGALTSLTVALIDTGVDLQVPEFAACGAAGAPGCPIVQAVRIAGAGSDDTSHGSNLAGILTRAGVQVVSLDVFDHQTATFEAVRAAIAWCIANRARYDLRVINLSLGEGVARSLCPTESLAVAIEEAAEAGLVTVVAAGDQGYPGALAVPACAPSAVSVGTVDGEGVAVFSNSALFLTLLAPGIDVAAGGQVMSGTSQSAAFVSAAAARMAHAFPADDPADLRRRLTERTTSLRDARNGVTTPVLALLPPL